MKCSLIRSSGNLAGRFPTQRCRVSRTMAAAKGSRAGRDFTLLGRFELAAVAFSPQWRVRLLKSRGRGFGPSFEKLSYLLSSACILCIRRRPRFKYPVFRYQFNVIFSVIEVLFSCKVSVTAIFTSLKFIPRHRSKWRERNSLKKELLWYSLLLCTAQRARFN